MDHGPFHFHRLARIMFLQLEPAEKAEVMAGLGALAESPTAEWPSQLARSLPGGSGDYLVRVDDTWRAVVRVSEGQPLEVRDLFRAELLETLAGRGAANGHEAK